MRVVVSVGGSVLAPDLEHERVSQYAAAVDRLVAEGCTVGAVVGGGGVARSYIETARELGANEVELDDVGIAVTRLNARLLIAALGEDAAPSPPSDYETAGEALRRGDVAVMGGVTAGQTTDAVAAALAEYANADLLVYATSVPGVYSADPNVEAGADRYDRMTPGELVELVAGIEMTAGSSAPVDLLAAKLIERSGVPTVVLDGTDPDRLLDVVLDGEHDGTAVLPAGTEPTEWVPDE